MVASTKGKKLSLLRGKKPREAEHAIVLDHQAVEDHAANARAVIAAREALYNARSRRPQKETLAELEQALSDAEAVAAESAEAAGEDVGFVTVKVRAMAPLAYAALKAEFPATDEDHQRLRDITGRDEDKAAWNRDEFQPRLVEHCVVDPEGVDLELAREWMNSWNETEWNLLVGACLRVNQETVDTASLVKASGRTRS